MLISSDFAVDTGAETIVSISGSTAFVGVSNASVTIGSDCVAIVSSSFDAVSGMLDVADSVLTVEVVSDVAIDVSLC